MPDQLKIALAQLNPTVGDLSGNVEKIREARSAAADQNADLVVFSELILSGYPPEDLVLKPAFMDDIMECLDVLAGETGDGGPALLLGTPWREAGEERPYNAAVLLDGGEIAAARLKHALPNYGVFDEKRIFAEGPLQGPVNFRDVRLGVLICEDMWVTDPAETLAESGAEILIVLNGSPFDAGKMDERLTRALARIVETDLPLIYVNQVGGQDELVFDGVSFAVNTDHKPAVRLPAWRESLVVSHWQRDGDDAWVCAAGEKVRHSEGLESIWQAMMMGLRDYVRKNGFPGVIIGLSGGIDSAATAAVAVDALGPEMVHGVTMPYKFTRSESLEDAEATGELLGIKFDTVPIAPAVEGFETMLAAMFEGTKRDITEENIQARARGVTLMAISNKFGFMVVTTGNKSEMSVGYATLYGDMCGGYSVLKDVYKSTLYELAEWRNAHRPENALGPEGPVVPERVITKTPSAELAPDQSDQDSLPPYDVLDDILQCLIEREESIENIVERGHDYDTVAWVEHMLYVAEYKRRQTPPGVKISSKVFGRDRRYPITNRFRDAPRHGRSEWLEEKDRS